MASETVTYQVTKENYCYNESKTSIGIKIKSVKGYTLPHPCWVPVKLVKIKEFDTVARITIPKSYLNNMLNPKLFTINGELVLNS